jgi:2-Cys peroxiredoxin 5
MIDQLNSDPLFSLFKQAWGRESGGAAAGVKFLSDSNAELTRAFGLVMETPMMPRTKRFSLIAEDGVVTDYFSSSEQASDTWAPAVLAKL